MYSFFTPPPTLRSDIYQRGLRGDEGSSGNWTENSGRWGRGRGRCPESHQVKAVSPGSQPLSWRWVGDVEGTWSLPALPAPLPTSASGREKQPPGVKGEIGGRRRPPGTTE